jgi:hypothetical protein
VEVYSKENSAEFLRKASSIAFKYGLISRANELFINLAPLGIFMHQPDKHIYNYAGGIQVLSKFAYKGGFEAVPEDEILSDDKRNEWAVGKALGVFIERSAPNR